MKNAFYTTLLFTFSLVIILLSPLTSFAQDDVIISIDETQVQIGDTVCLPLMVENFEEIVAMQASINFNPFLLEFTDVTDISPILGLNENNFGLSQIDSGIFRFNFFNASEPFTLPDSSSMFSLCFEVIGQAGSFAPVNLTNFPIPIEIIKDFEPVGFGVNNGGVHILPSNNFTYVALSCAADSTLPNGSVFFHVYGDSSQFPATINYQHLQSPGLNGSFVFMESSFLEISMVPSGLMSFSFTQNGIDTPSDTVGIFDFGKLSAEFTVNPPSCHDNMDGSIMLSNVLPEGIYYVASWGENGIFETAIENLENGTFYHYLTDAGGCTIVDTFELNTTPINLEFAVSDNECPGDSTGNILAIASGGTPFSGSTYRYTWASGEMQTTLNTLRSNLPSGIYSLTTSDRNGCERVDEFEVINENEINLSPVISNVSCFGGEDGSASFTLSYLHQDGSPDFVFTFSDSIANIDADSNLLFISPLSGGDYILSVNDTSAGGCTSIFQFEIIEANSLLNLDIVDQSDESCLGENDGRIEIAISGGMTDQSGEYEIIWSNGVDQTINDNLGSGEYSVRVTDFLGCERSALIEIGTTVPPMITALQSQDPVCFDSEDGTIEIQIEEGSGGSLVINWNNGATGAQLDNLGAGIYTAIVTDEKGCTDQITTELTAPDSFVISTVVTDESSSGAFDGGVEIEVMGGTAPYTYILGENNPSSTPVFLELTAGDYCVTVIDANDCETEVCFSVGVMTSTIDLTNNMIARLYPNPARSQITLELKKMLSESVEIQLIRTDGRIYEQVIHLGESNQVVIPIDELIEGIYYLRLISAELSQLIPFSVIR